MKTGLNKNGGNVKKPLLGSWKHAISNGGSLLMLKDDSFFCRSSSKMD